MINPYNRALNRIEKNYNKDINVIPYGFDNISYYLPGVEKETFNIITASTGVCKSQFTDYIALHKPMDFFWNIYRQSQGSVSPLKVKIFYWSLEMATEIKATQILINHIFTSQSGITNPFNAPRLGLKTVMSVFQDKNKRLNNAQLEILKSYDEFFEWYYQHVELISEKVSPYGVYKTIHDYFEDPNIGEIVKKKVISNKYNETTQKVEEHELEVFDYYKYNLENENLFVIIIIDHASLISDKGFSDKRLAIEKLSSNLLELRNKFSPSIYLIQQQSSSQEQKDGFFRPTLSGLGDNKAVGRDVDYVIGLYDPVRANEKYCLGWDLKKLNPRYREGSLLKSRYGISNLRWSMFFDGTTETFWQLPSEDDVKNSQNKAIIDGWYRLAESLPIVL